MFRPTDVRPSATADEDLTRLEFRVDGVPYKAEAGYDGWVPNEVTEVIEKAFKTHCNKLGFHAVHFPEFSQEADHDHLHRPGVQGGGEGRAVAGGLPSGERPGGVRRGRVRGGVTHHG